MSGADFAVPKCHEKNMLKKFNLHSQADEVMPTKIGQNID